VAAGAFFAEPEPLSLDARPFFAAPPSVAEPEGDASPPDADPDPPLAEPTGSLARLSVR
jgi:hypothetical protein